VNLEDLRSEFHQSTIGPDLYALIAVVTRMVASNYPAHKYGAGRKWADEALDELTQDVAIMLIDEGQLEYAFDIATDLPHFRGLIGRSVKRVLYRRYSSPVIRRLVDRIDKIAKGEKYLREKKGGVIWISSVTNPSKFRYLSDQELESLSRTLESIPKTVENPASKKASMVYRGADLEKILDTCIQAMGGVSRANLMKILENLLTSWLPADLDMSEGYFENGTLRVFSGNDTQEVARVVGVFVNASSDQEVALVHMKIQNFSDTQVAESLVISRTTVSNRKQILLSRFGREVLAILDSSLHGAAWTMWFFQVSDRYEQLEVGNDS